MSAPDALSAAIAARAAHVRARIVGACARAGRAASEVTLVAVTKTLAVETVRAGVAAGLCDFGENRVQELSEKAEAVPGEAEGGAVRWHLIGPLQRNKARDALRYADLFHALDSLRLAEALDKRTAGAGRVFRCLVQVNVSGEATKSGVAPERAHTFLDQLAPFSHLRVEGLMALASPAESPEALEVVVRPQFRRLRRLAEAYPPRAHADLRLLSMGMSGDFEAAIAQGATHVRVGSAIFGARAYEARADEG